MNALNCLLLVCGCLTIFSGCKSTPKEVALAEIDGRPIFASELDKRFGKELSEQREKLFRLEKQKLDEYISATLLTQEANKRGVSVSTLLEQEINGKISPVGEEEVKTFFDANKSRLPVDIEKVREQIRDYLREKKFQDRKAELVSSIRSKASIKTYLTPPVLYRANVLVSSGAPSKGAEKSIVTLVKFEDFQCPYCKAVQPRFAELLKKYDGKLRLFHKDLPLDAIHPQARQAAEAARCAGDQGKFWEYHDKLYEHAPKLSVDDLKNYAKEVGLNADTFDTCFSGGKFKAAVVKDLNEGAGLGLTGTPSFFINGRELSGALPLEAFTAIIDEELALAK